MSDAIVAAFINGGALIVGAIITGTFLWFLRQDVRHIKHETNSMRHALEQFKLEEGRRQGIAAQKKREAE